MAKATTRFNMQVLVARFLEDYSIPIRQCISLAMTVVYYFAAVRERMAKSSVSKRLKQTQYISLSSRPPERVLTTSQTRIREVCIREKYNQREKPTKLKNKH